MDLHYKLRNFLDEEKKLRSFPAKRKMKLYALMYYASKFESGREYTEKEINAVINEHSVFNDPATIRRELYEYKFLNRKTDCSAYWLEENQPEIEE